VKIFITPGAATTHGRLFRKQLSHVISKERSDWEIPTISGQGDFSSLWSSK